MPPVDKNRATARARSNLHALQQGQAEGPDESSASPEKPRQEGPFAQRAKHAGRACPVGYTISTTEQPRRPLRQLAAPFGQDSSSQETKGDQSIQSSRQAAKPSQAATQILSTPVHTLLHNLSARESEKSPKHFADQSGSENLGAAWQGSNYCASCYNQLTGVREKNSNRPSSLLPRGAPASARGLTQPKRIVLANYVAPGRSSNYLRRLPLSCLRRLWEIR